MWCRQKVLKYLNRKSIIKDYNLTSTLFVCQNQCHSQPNEIEYNEIPASARILDLKKVLSTEKVQFEDGYTCFSAQCVNCSHGTRGSVYINKITGFCLCMKCRETGDWEDFNHKIKTKESKDGNNIALPPRNKFKKVNTIEEYTEQWKNLKSKCQALGHLPAPVLKKIIKLFKLRAQSETRVLSYLDILYDDSRQVLYFPLMNNKKKILGIKELTVNGVESCQPVKKCPGILRYIPARVPEDFESVIIVHRIKDFIALSSVKHNSHVVCLPHGTSALPLEILPLLEQYNKIILWFGSDELSNERSFATKLKEDRCFLVKCNEKPETFIEKTAESDVREMLKNARPISNKYVITFANLKEEIYSGLTNQDLSQGMKWKRFPILNKILRGHRRGELTILTGPTGSGKTTFLSEYSLDLASQGVSTLWGSFEVRNERLASTMLHQFVMKPLVENLKEFDSWAREFEKLPIYFLKFHGQQSIDLVMEVVEHATYVHDVRHLVIDNLQFMLGLTLADERFMDRFYKQDKVIAAFRTFATQHNCHVTLIIHPRKERDSEELTISSFFGTAKASQEADNIMIIQKKKINSLNFKKYLQIVKNRYNGDLGEMPLQFTKSTLSFATKEN